jgi:hypothetical protein
MGMLPSPNPRASEDQAPTLVVTLPGSYVLSGLMIVSAVSIGVLYALRIGTEQGLLALLGVSAVCLVLLVLGTALRFNRVAVELDDTHLIMRPHPLPLGRMRRVPRGDIEGFNTEITGTTKRGRPRYALKMLRISRGSTRIAFYDTDGDLAERAQELLSERLGC